MIRTLILISIIGLFISCSSETDKIEKYKLEKNNKIIELYKTNAEFVNAKIEDHIDIYMNTRHRASRVFRLIDYAKYWKEQNLLLINNINKNTDTNIIINAFIFNNDSINVMPTRGGNLSERYESMQEYPLKKFNDYKTQIISKELFVSEYKKNIYNLYFSIMKHAEGGLGSVDCKMDEMKYVALTDYKEYKILDTINLTVFSSFFVYHKSYYVINGDTIKIEKEDGYFDIPTKIYSKGNNIEGLMFNRDRGTGELNRFYFNKEVNVNEVDADK